MTKQNERRQARRTNRQLIASQLSDLDTDVLAYVFARDGFYERLADQLLTQKPFYRSWRGHWLCKQLNECAQGVDPGTYVRQLQQPTQTGLIRLGCPVFIAAALGASAGFGLNIALGHTPMGHLTKTLRVLIGLVCPDLELCPASNEVFKTFAVPGLAEQLKSLESFEPRR